MAKIATDVKQSQQLAKMLPIESADMCYSRIDVEIDEGKAIAEVLHRKLCSIDLDVVIPSWSLSALMEIVRTKSHNEQSGLFMGKTEPYSVFCGSCNQTKVYNDAVDACVEMIIKLHENNLL